ncbi:MAG TPA: TAXI family TRAP transporter solute-binding subunit [Syntrophales bacterium]|nr:TAXI family TRAP transporter solute-binding subunit [Syntrophales bacterium]
MSESPSSVSRIRRMLAETFGLGPAATLSAVVFAALIIVSAVFWFFHSAPPRTIVVTSGDEGTRFRRSAEQYAKILARSGVTVKVLPSEGSRQNLERLADPSVRVDVGFVQTGVSKGQHLEKLVSLGSVFYEPLFVFYRSGKPLDALSQFAGKRLAIGREGTGAQVLALELLALNGIKPGGPTKLLEMEDEDAEAALLAGRIDAAFMMSDSASSTTLRGLLFKPGMRLFDFSQADAYTRRIGYLYKTVLPRGVIDLGKNVPDHDLALISPTVELIARASLHPALSDLLLEAATEVHSRAGWTNKRGEFPAPRENEFRISADAGRFYRSGKSFLYRYLPFRLASLLNRFVVVFVPTVLILIPGMRSIPAIYRWQMRLRIIRWYRALMVLERDMAGACGPDKGEELQRQLAHIERSVNRLKVPASFAEQFYGLRVHIDFVREKLGHICRGGQGDTKETAEA